MSGLVNFFKKIGHFLARALDIVHQVIPEAILEHAVAYVKQAETDFLDNGARRDWVIGKLVSELHLPESVARLAVELAVQIVKKESEKAIDQVA